MSNKIEKNKVFYQKQFDWYKDCYLENESVMKAACDSISDRILSFANFDVDSILEIGSGMGFQAMSFSKKGYLVEAVEIVGELCDFASKRSEEQGLNVNFINDDFLKHQFDKKYDVIYYLDGFGVGSDSDQKSFIRKMGELLSDRGFIYLEVYNPLYWSKTAGVTMQIYGDISREYGYDLNENRMIDSWKNDSTGDVKTQSLGCYTLNQIEKMCKDNGLKISEIIPGGKMNYETMELIENATLEDCMSYFVIIKK